MIKRETILKNKTGFHIRPAQEFTKMSSQYKSIIKIYNENGLEADGKSLLGIMTLGFEFGSKIIIEADGVDEDKAVEDLVMLIDNKLYDM